MSSLVDRLKDLKFRYFEGRDFAADVFFADARVFPGVDLTQ